MLHDHKIVINKRSGCVALLVFCVKPLDKYDHVDSVSEQRNPLKNYQTSIPCTSIFYMFESRLFSVICSFSKIGTLVFVEMDSLLFNAISIFDKLF